MGPNESTDNLTLITAWLHGLYFMCDIAEVACL